VGAAVQVVCREASPPEQRENGPGVKRLATVRSGGHGQLLDRKVEAALPSGGEERRELKRLGRGAQEDRLERVAGGGKKPAVGRHHRNGPPVN
jgi:hypothetical protein